MEDSRYEDRSASKRYSLDLLHFRPPCLMIHCSRRGKMMRSSVVVPRTDDDEDRSTSKQYALELLHFRPPCLVIHRSRRERIDDPRVSSVVVLTLTT